ncbi:11268_t:CDS:2 [Entrophospora sp. SA101]|nr:12692_t:CDS:2 [Entrophospora sp. SA101]CAJ0869185.1 11268_t:CDS:2 [Entrophospora sp. SA101]
MPRSLKKQLFVNEKLLKKIEKANQENKKSAFKTWARGSVISPEMIGHTLLIHNGKKFLSRQVTPEMVNHKIEMLIPKKTKYRYPHRTKYEGQAKGNKQVNWGQFGLQAQQVRMGSGKGAIDSWVAVVKQGTVMFEVSELDREIVYKALTQASHKLPKNNGEAKELAKEEILAKYRATLTILQMKSKMGQVTKTHQIKKIKKEIALMKDGEKRKATQIVYQAAEIIEKKTATSFLTILEGAVSQVKPALETRSRRIGGGVYRMPVKLAEEINNAYQGTGEAFKKKENIRKEAEGNRQHERTNTNKNQRKRENKSALLDQNKTDYEIVYQDTISLTEEEI